MLIASFMEYGPAIPGSLTQTELDQAKPHLI